MTDLVETVSRKPVPSYARNILAEVMCNDAEGEDVEVGRGIWLIQIRGLITSIRFLTA